MSSPFLPVGHWAMGILLSLSVKLPPLSSRFEAYHPHSGQRKRLYYSIGIMHYSPFFFPFSKKSSSVGHSAWPALTHNLPRLLWPSDRISWHAAMSRNCAVLVTFSGTLVGPVPRHKVGQNYHCVSTITMIWSSGSPGHQRNTFFFGLINRAKQSVNVRHDSKLWMAKQHLLPTVQPHT